MHRDVTLWQEWDIFCSSFKKLPKGVFEQQYMFSSSMCIIALSKKMVATHHDTAAIAVYLSVVL